MLFAGAQAYGYGGGMSMGGGYGGMGGGMAMGGYGGGMGMGGGYGGMGGGYGAVPLAIKSRHNVQYYDVPSSGYVKPTTVEIGATHIPLNMIFRSASSNLNVKQYHQGTMGSVQESYSQDEPHLLRHTVKKPVYQEIREVISPYRKITQEIRPVQEEINTIVARGTKGYGGGYGAGAGMAMAGGYGGDAGMVMAGGYGAGAAY